MNAINLLGRLTKDPELRYTSGNNTAVASFNLAVNRQFAQEGQPQADFLNCVAWSKTAEFVSKYFTKGQQIALQGRLQTRTWDDTEGKKHYVTEVVAEKVFFAGNKNIGEQSNTSNSAPKTNQDFPETPGDGFYPADEDDDLPF